MSPRIRRRSRRRRGRLIGAALVGAVVAIVAIAGASATADAARQRCAVGNQTAVRLHERARDDLREFYWGYTARIHERAPAGAELGPAHDVHARLPWISLESALERSSLPDREALAALARSRVVDLLDPQVSRDVDHALSRASAAQIEPLLFAAAPNLRAHVWRWLATTRRGGCVLAELDPATVELAASERSLVVEHGHEVLLRPVADYVLAARARMIAGDAGSLDVFLEQLATTPIAAGAPRVHPFVKASAHSMLIRRGRFEHVEQGLADPYPAIRAAVALALIDADPGVRGADGPMVEMAAHDKSDRVTEAIVGRLLAAQPPDDSGAPRATGALADSDDPRVMAAVARWQGKGDPLAPLPPPGAHTMPVTSTLPAPPVPIAAPPTQPRRHRDDASSSDQEPPLPGVLDGEDW